MVCYGSCTLKNTQNTSVYCLWIYVYVVNIYGWVVSLGGEGEGRDWIGGLPNSDNGKMNTLHPFLDLSVGLRYFIIKILF